MYELSYRARAANGNALCCPSPRLKKSIPFYERLGFSTSDTDRCAPIGWARLQCEDGSAVMFLGAEHAVDSSAQAVTFCMYAPDLTGRREHLSAHGVKVPPTDHPEYMPGGKINITDPDGCKIETCQWGRAEQEAWEKRIGAKK